MRCNLRHQKETEKRKTTHSNKKRGIGEDPQKKEKKYKGKGKQTQKKHAGYFSSSEDADIGGRTDTFTYA